jgi:hypothetical protein
VKFSWRAGAPLAPAAPNTDLQPVMSKPSKTFKVSRTRWNDVVLVCRKCSKKLDGGFGPDGDKTLKKALRRYLHAGKGRKADLAVVGADCFDVCPKNAVVAVNTRRPEELLIVPAGADLLEVKARLGLDDGRRLKSPLAVVTPVGDPIETPS